MTNADESSQTDREKPSLARNTTSYIGALITLIALLNIVFLVIAEMTSSDGNPYVGILAYMVLPAVLILGLGLVAAGMLLERRRRRRTRPEEIARFPRIDLNNARTRRLVTFALLGGVAFIFVSLLGSYKAYEYTDSTEFCGALCHQVMHPEYIAYKASPHARVGCVDCHVGPGAGWYVRSKLSGAYQVYSVLMKKYPKPITTPVHNLRPAQETCEQCHWPEKFFGAQLKVFNHFGYDEANTPRETQMLIKTGGGSPTGGLTAGIHWHMNIANEITYAASDDQHQKIPWVQMKGPDGKVTVFTAQDAEMTPEEMDRLPRRRMDCVSCHNRPTHIYVPPDRSVDRALLAGTISTSLPYIKQQAVETLSKEYGSTNEALVAIHRDLRAYYRENHPDLQASDKRLIDRAIAEVRKIYQTTIFPEMRVDWRTHPDNIGHFYSNGCFRCHDDRHVSSDGKVIRKECDVCHAVISQKEGGTVMVEAPHNEFQHPVDLGDLTLFDCADCHSGGPM
ncbi:MAG TPA: NapC/NirT family cytochrome c [Thermoanaerobaculia bacterium]|nr:NapC/NirT family cytochrome c [Thermoanaerobaculia bacterium]